MTVQLLVAAQRELLQWIHQVTAVATLLSQGQVLAQSPVLMRKVGHITGLGLALFQLLEVLGKGLPLGL
jgi:hypothetical protein